MSIPKLKDLLSEKITLPIKIGDTVMMGKFKNTGKNKADYNVDDDIINIKPTSKFKDFLVTVFHEIDHALDAKKYGKKKYKEKYEREMNIAVDKGGDAHDDNYFEKKAEKYGRMMAKQYLKKK